MILMRVVLVLAALYLGAGLLFAALFHARGLERTDPAAHGASRAFRLLITPGLAALWPVMAVKWRRAIRPGGRP